MTEVPARIQGGAVEVACATGFGPRVTHMSWHDGPNVFAELDPDVTASPPGGAPSVHLRGGHRLWTAPETPATYVPDDDAVEVEAGDRWVSVCQPAMSNRPLERTITVTVDASAPAVRARHRFRNRGRSPLRLAPWAITQLPPGGVAVVPLPTGARDDLGLQANTAIVLWPYTRLDDPRLWLSTGAVTLRGDALPGLTSADPSDHACKIGVAGDVRWVAHVRAGTVFVARRAAPGSDAELDPHVDLGAGVQTYTDHRFCEVETLGVLLDLEPGADVTYDETWELRRTELDPDDGEQLTELLGELDRPLDHDLD